jgi:hypothetical protein
MVGLQGISECILISGSSRELKYANPNVSSSVLALFKNFCEFFYRGLFDMCTLVE